MGKHIVPLKLTQSRNEREYWDAGISGWRILKWMKITFWTSMLATNQIYFKFGFYHWSTSQSLIFGYKYCWFGQYWAWKFVFKVPSTWKSFEFFKKRLTVAKHIQNNKDYFKLNLKYPSKKIDSIVKFIIIVSLLDYGDILWW